MNVQFVVMPGRRRIPQVYVLEVNPRASRTVPFISKVTGVPMVNVATKVMLGRQPKEQGYDSGLWPKRKLVAIKAPVFSMSKLTGVDTYLGPGDEVHRRGHGHRPYFRGGAGQGAASRRHDAAAQRRLLLTIADRDKAGSAADYPQARKPATKLYATEGTAAMIEAAGLPVKITSKKLKEGHPNIIDMIIDGTINGVVNTITGGPCSGAGRLLHPPRRRGKAHTVLYFAGHHPRRNGDDFPRQPELHRPAASRLPE